MQVFEISKGESEEMEKDQENDEWRGQWKYHPADEFQDTGDRGRGGQSAARGRGRLPRKEGSQR